MWTEKGGTDVVVYGFERESGVARKGITAFFLNSLSIIMAFVAFPVVLVRFKEQYTVKLL